MKLLLLSSPNFFVEEDKILATLFEEGLDILKPQKLGKGIVNPALHNIQTGVVGKDGDTAFYTFDNPFSHAVTVGHRTERLENEGMVGEYKVTAELFRRFDSNARAVERTEHACDLCVFIGYDVDAVVVPGL